MSMRETAVLVFLAVNALRDVKSRQISPGLTLLFALGGTIYSLWKGRNVLEFFLLAGLGGMLAAVSVISGGGLGLGDCWLLLAVGTVTGVRTLLALLCLSLLLAALWSLILLVLFRKGAKEEFPFVPFLLAGYIGGLFLW